MAKAKTGTRANGNGEALAAIGQFEPFLTAGNKVFEAWTAVGTELVELGRARVDQSIELGQAMARSSSFNEALDLQAKFARSMMDDFLGAASRLAAIGTRPMMESFAAMQNTTYGRTPPNK
jgi:hypothetical protein